MATSTRREDITARRSSVALSDCAPHGVNMKGCGRRRRHAGRHGTKYRNIVITAAQVYGDTAGVAEARRWLLFGMIESPTSAADSRDVIAGLLDILPTRSHTRHYFAILIFAWRRRAHHIRNTTTAYISAVRRAAAAISIAASVATPRCRRAPPARRQCRRQRKARDEEVFASPPIFSAFEGA